MLRSLNVLMNFTIHFGDDEVGKVTDIYIDKSTWSLRYLILDTGKWLSGKTIIVSTQNLDKFDTDNQTITIHRSLNDVESSPEFKNLETLTRKFEENLFAHYQWVPYWTAQGIAQSGAAPVVLPVQDANEDTDISSSRKEPDLLTFEDIKSYEVVHEDQTLGWVKDGIYDDGSWDIHSIIFDTGKTLREKIIEVPVKRISSININDKHVLTEMSRQEAEMCDPFNLMALMQKQTKQ